jgi:hypothetical protein
MLHRGHRRKPRDTCIYGFVSKIVNTYLLAPKITTGPPQDIDGAADPSEPVE